MTLAPYQGMFLTPGMGADVFAHEADNLNFMYDHPFKYSWVNYAVISGAARDAGNTGNTTVLRTGLIMGKITASGKWKQWDSAAVDGSQYAQGVLAAFGLNTQNQSAADADRVVGTIITRGGILNPQGLCTAASASYGIARSGTGLVVRKGLFYAFGFSDDLMGDLVFPLSAR